MLAKGSGGRWSAFGRVLITVVYTALERVVVTFASDPVVTIDDLVQWLGSDDMNGPSSSARLPGFTKDLKSPYRGPTRMAEMNALESALVDSFAAAGIRLDQSLARRIVSLKSLRNDCAHVRATSEDVNEYHLAAGLPSTIVAIRPEHLVLILRTLVATTKLLAHHWFVDGGFVDSDDSQRIHVVSDLPLVAETMARRLERRATGPSYRDRGLFVVGPSGPTTACSRRRARW